MRLRKFLLQSNSIINIIIRCKGTDIKKNFIRIIKSNLKAAECNEHLRTNVFTYFILPTGEKKKPNSG
ncbi:MAG: hypothetical protein D8M51_04105 [Ignavibacteriae bacterium]|nr:hypothetical protein [Ignavibacteriota bacterium]